MLADGHVQFIKNSIDSWPNDNGVCPSVALNFNTGVFYIVPGARVGVWQALSTRNGGEVIGADQY